MKCEMGVHLLEARSKMQTVGIWHVEEQCWRHYLFIYLGCYFFFFHN